MIPPLELLYRNLPSMSKMTYSIFLWGDMSLAVSVLVLSFDVCCAVNVQFVQVLLGLSEIDPDIPDVPITVISGHPSRTSSELYIPGNLS
jgi:hypothetical protein